MSRYLDLEEARQALLRELMLVEHETKLIRYDLIRHEARRQHLEREIRSLVRRMLEEEE